SINRVTRPGSPFSPRALSPMTGGEVVTPIPLVVHGSTTTTAKEGSMKRILLSTLAVALLTPTATATANTYDVYSCWAGAGTFRNPNASSAAWTMDQANAGGHFAPNNDCGRN